MTLLWVMIAIAIIHVVMDNRQPAKTMAWALVIFFIPVVGIVFYLFFGINHRRERLVSQRSLDQLTKRSMLGFVEQQDLHIPEHCKPLVDLFVNQNMSLPFKVGRVDIQTDGYAFFPALLHDIAAARHHIHITMYIFEADALGHLIADALIAKARRGVEVRVIYDDVGCWKVNRSFFESLRAGGVELAPYLPVHFPTFTSKANYRNHRKLVVIDGKVGYIGGMNIAMRYVRGMKRGVRNDEGGVKGQLLPWRDTMLRVEGGIVYSLQRAFLVDWYFVDRTLITGRQYYPPVEGQPTGDSCIGQVVTSAPDTTYPEIMQGYVQAITTARSYIFIETPYFLPSEPVLFALKAAAVRGVDVRIICPFYSDSRFADWTSRSYLRELHEAGAKIFLYQTGFLHSKLMVCDDVLSTCGSTNIDIRSFENNFEANIFLYDDTMALRMKQVFLDDLSKSIDISQVAGRLRPKFLQKLWESLIRLLSPLL
jgi:cardiolipin synthase